MTFTRAASAVRVNEHWWFLWPLVAPASRRPTPPAVSAAAATTAHLRIAPSSPCELTRPTRPLGRTVTGREPNGSTDTTTSRSPQSGTAGGVQVVDRDQPADL